MEVLRLPITRFCMTIDSGWNSEKNKLVGALIAQCAMRAVASKIKSGADEAAGGLRAPAGCRKRKDGGPANKIEDMKNPARATIRNNAMGARPGTGCSLPPSALGLRKNAQECFQGERGRRCLQGTWRAA